MQRSMKRVLGVGVVLGMLGTAFSGSALGAVVGTSPIPTYQANGWVSVISWATHEPYTVIDLDVDANGVLVAGGGNGGNFASLDPLTGARQWIGGTDGNVQAIAVVGGVVYAGGHWANYCGQTSGAHTCPHPTPRPKLLAVDESSGALLPWNPGANSSLGVFALAGDAVTGNLFAGGDFPTIGGRSQQHYAEFTP